MSPDFNEVSALSMLDWTAKHVTAPTKLKFRDHCNANLAVYSMSSFFNVAGRLNDTSELKQVDVSSRFGTGLCGTTKPSVGTGGVPGGGAKGGSNATSGRGSWD